MAEELQLEGYCLKCKEKRIMVSPKAEWSANGAPATRGKCPECGTNMYKRGRTPAHEHLPPPEIKPKTKKKKSKKKQAKRSGKLVIVESPAKARTIGRYLGRGYTVKSSVGHVRDLLRSRLSVDVDNNFEPEYRVPNDKRSTVKELKAAAAKAKEIFLATDADREGEAIAWHVMESADMEPERTKRVVFHEITKPAILAAFEKPREIDLERVNAQQTRRILDRLVGYKLSPLLWRKVRSRLSAGRVQSVAVRLVVDRERAIDDFEPEEYWSIEAELKQQKAGQNGSDLVNFTAKLLRYQGEEPVLPDEETVLPHLETLETSVWQVEKVRTGQRRRRPAAPFTTSTLQQDASRQLRFNTSKTMRVAQQLYEGVNLEDEGLTGLITYMRTDSVSISQQAQDEARQFIVRDYGESFLPETPNVYKTKSKTAQEAHEAIRPTSVMRRPADIKKSLKRDQYRLYQLIWRRFVASQMAPAVYDTVSTDIRAGAEAVPLRKRPYLFRATGSNLRFLGFLRVYEESSADDKPTDDGSQIPVDLQKEELLDLLKLIPNQHFTQPPSRFSEATLVKELEENGIGRPSTYASIISTIQKRGYVTRDEGRLVPTETGELVTDMLSQYFPSVMSVDFTAAMEEDLDKIAEGAEWVPVVANFWEDFAEKLEAADEALPKVDLRSEPEPVGRECPECGNDLVYRQGRFGKFIGCSNFPSCRFTEQILIKVGVDCPNDGGDLVERRTRKGRVFYSCANYPDCEWTSWKRPLPQKCEFCQSVVVQRNNTTAQCTQCGERQPIVQQQSEESAEEPERMMG
ncbi:MAG TPA: type I DNA topoisomerase [Anaerolineae bacterium]|nr:type I DNA topoisomerase [Anaerolineae bacterium]